LANDPYLLQNIYKSNPDMIPGKPQLMYVLPLYKPNFINQNPH